MEKSLLHLRVIFATWLCGMFYRLADYFFEINQTARIDEWKAKHPGIDPCNMGWPEWTWNLPPGRIISLTPPGKGQGA